MLWCVCMYAQKVTPMADKASVTVTTTRSLMLGGFDLDH